ncbi:hypothetical protein [Bacillus pseudomycoides]|nr:hypothetical protein [Bacillus pseudomycoides]
MNLSIHGELQPFAEELQRYTVSKGIPKGTPFGSLFITMYSNI